jgi:hypothetical protein
VLALAVSTRLGPSKLPNICSSLPLSSNHASVLHGISLRFGQACPQAQFRHKLSSDLSEISDKYCGRIVRLLLYCGGNVRLGHSVHITSRNTGAEQ